MPVLYRSSQLCTFRTLDNGKTFVVYNDCQTSDLWWTKFQNWNFFCLVLRLSLPNPLKPVVNWGRGCSWNSAERRCSNYNRVIGNFIGHWGASCISCLTVNLKNVDGMLTNSAFQHCKFGGFRLHLVTWVTMQYVDHTHRTILYFGYDVFSVIRTTIFCTENLRGNAKYAISRYLSFTGVTISHAISSTISVTCICFHISCDIPFVELWPFSKLATAVDGEMWGLDYMAHDSKVAYRLLS